MFSVTELINVIFLLNKCSLQDVVQQNTVDNVLNGVKGLKKMAGKSMQVHGVTFSYIQAQPFH